MRLIFPVAARKEMNRKLGDVEEKVVVTVGDRSIAVSMLLCK